MKKVFGMFMALILMTSVSFAESIAMPNACHDYANNAVQQEMDQWGAMSSQDEIDAYVWYYNVCDENGPNNTLDPVLL